MTLPRLQSIYKTARSERKKERKKKRKKGAMVIYTDIEFISEAHILRGRHYAAAPGSLDRGVGPLRDHGTWYVCDDLDGVR